jgi:hypothetical protein
MFATELLEFPVSLSVAAKARITNPAFQDWSINEFKGIAFLADLTLATHACDKLSIAGPADCHENRLFASNLKLLCL